MRRRYKNYLREEDASVPKTSSWRSKKQAEQLHLQDSFFDDSDTDSLSSLEFEIQGSNNYQSGTDIDVVSSEDDTSINMSLSSSHCGTNSTDNVGSLTESEDEQQQSMSDVSSMCSESTSQSDMDMVQNEFEDDLNSSFSSNEGNEDDSKMGFINGGNKPIYTGATLTRSQSLLLIMAYMLRHNLTDNALTDFLLVMNMHLPHIVPLSKHRFYKEFIHGAYTKHYFCQDCSDYFGPTKDCNPDDICSCSDAKSIGVAKSQNWFFCYWEIESRLKLLLQDDNIVDDILNRQQNAAGGLKDCTDGELYEHMREVHGYGRPTDISLLWNCDGVQIFKSSNQQLWPIQCAVLEIPPEKRQANIIMPALWFHKDQVDMSLLLQPFVNEMNILSRTGFHLNGYWFRVFAPICTADAPARPKVRNTMQFNGKYGCDWCLHPGERVATGRGHARAYPHEPALQRDRTHQQMEDLAIEAQDKQCVMFGVKGPSTLSYVTHIDLVNGFVPDYMHCALLGVTRQLSSLWFNSANHDEPWYIGQPAKQQQYDAMLKGVVPPKEIRRLPRSICAKDQWKANEYKTFALYYSLILLDGILPRQFLNHYFLFVLSLHILLGTRISGAELTKVDAVLKHFVLKMRSLYWLRNCTFNVHQLIHFAKSARMCGPLWATSTFIFESNNAVLRKMVQGTQYVSNQICNTYVVVKTIPLFMKHTTQGDDEVIQLLERLVHGKMETTSAVQFNESLTFLSKAKVRLLSREEELAMEVASQNAVNRVAYEYSRFVWKGKLYDTKNYTRSSKRQNSYVKCVENCKNVHCQIKSLVVVKECQCDIQRHQQCQCPRRSLLFCTPYRVVNDRLFYCREFNIHSNFMCEVTEQQETVISLPLESIVMKCVLVKKGTRVFLVDMPNMIEME